MREMRVKVRVPEWIYQAGLWFVLSYRRLRYGEAFRIITLTKGLVAIVSPKDYDLIAKYNWYATRCKNTYYAQRNERANDGRRKQKHIKMHRQIMGAKDNELIDHQNHNGLDNRQSNLRIATAAENGFNRQKTTALCTSRFKGVCRDKKADCWRAQGKHNGKQLIIGYFDNEIEAAKAYDEWAKKKFGQFAALNFPEKQNGRLGDVSFKICYGGYRG
jgi:hypothetical protein